MTSEGLCVLNASDTHRNSSPTPPPLQVAERDRQTGSKEQSPTADPLCGVATQVRHINKKWSLGPPNQTGGPKCLRNRPINVKAFYCFGFLWLHSRGGLCECPPCKGSKKGTSFIIQNLCKPVGKDTCGVTQC